MGRRVELNAAVGGQAAEGGAEQWRVRAQPAAERRRGRRRRVVAAARRRVARVIERLERLADDDRAIHARLESSAVRVLCAGRTARRRLRRLRRAAATALELAIGVARQVDPLVIVVRRGALRGGRTAAAGREPLTDGRRGSVEHLLAAVPDLPPRRRRATRGVATRAERLARRARGAKQRFPCEERRQGGLVVGRRRELPEEAPEVGCADERDHMADLHAQVGGRRRRRRGERRLHAHRRRRACTERVGVARRGAAHQDALDTKRVGELVADDGPCEAAAGAAAARLQLEERLTQHRAAEVARVRGDNTERALRQEAGVGRLLYCAEGGGALAYDIDERGVALRGDGGGEVAQDVVRERTRPRAELDDEEGPARRQRSCAPERVEPISEHRPERGSHGDGEGGEVGRIGRLAKLDAAVHIVSPRWVV